MSVAQSDEGATTETGSAPWMVIDAPLVAFPDLAYAEWAVVVLTAAAVIVTAVGIIVAVLAFFGYATLSRGARERAAQAAEQAFAGYIASEAFDRQVERAVDRAVSSGRVMIDGNRLTGGASDAGDRSNWED